MAIKITENRLVLVSTVVAAVANIIIWIVLLIKFGITSDPYPLHFNIVYGIDFVSAGYRIYEIPATGLVILLVNIFLARFFFRLEKLFGWFLLFGSVGVQLFLFIAALALIVLNR